MRNGIKSHEQARSLWINAKRKQTARKEKTVIEINKIKHKLSARRKGGEVTDSTYRNLIKQTILTTLRFEEVDLLCEVNVLITGDQGIRKYNKNFRGIDKVTDVLSFPMQEFSQPGWRHRCDSELDEENGILQGGSLPLGDIVISTGRARKQAKDSKHTFERETTHLIIHSVLHLLGYDHMDEENEKLMRLREKQIMKKMGYMRV
jgi:probable rRNA maturation factor